jgi:hypothetical protein
MSTAMVQAARRGWTYKLQKTTILASKVFEVNFMKRMGSLILIALFSSLMCFGQSDTATPAAPAAATKAVGHGSFPVKLTKALDSNKLKEGEAVEVETVGSFKLPDGTLVPKGSKLAGHVVASQARSKGDAKSQLTVVFDKLNVANGKQLSVKGLVQAAFPPAEEPAPMMAGKASGAAGGGYSPGAAGGGYGAGSVGTVTDTKTGANTTSDSKPEQAADPKSSGVHGIHDLELGQDGSFFSGGKQVKLGSGVRMIVRVDILD